MKRILILIGCILVNTPLFSQQNDLKLSSYAGERTITALKSITLQDGFHIPLGSNVILSIQTLPNAVSVPTATQTYVLKRTFRDTVKLAELGQIRTIDRENQTIQYLDAFGLSKQVVVLMASPTYKDIVSYQEYDGLGREAVKYLPYAEQTSNNGSYKSAAKSNQTGYYQVGGGWDTGVVKTSNPYATTVFESSPLGRVQEQGSPGTVFQPASSRTTTAGRTVVQGYGTNLNTTLEAVNLWKVTYSGNTSIGAGTTSNYEAGSLSKTIIKDENWVSTDAKAGTVEEYRDFEGRVVLKRVWETDTKKLDTYYVYDGFGDLRYVIPPGYATTATPTTVNDNNTDFNELIYAYRYDGRRRLIEKKVPGKGWEWLVYNANDQLVLTQDALQRAQNNWSYIKYDVFGNKVQVGIYTKTFATRALAQADVDKVTKYWEARNGTASYTNQAYPVDGQQPLAVNYYDDYSFAGGNTANLQASGITKSTMTAGLLTGSMVWTDDRADSLLSIRYYDDNGRVIQGVSQNHLKGTDRVTKTYNFPGELLSSIRVHTPASGTATTIVSTNEYDHVGRPVKTRKKINSQMEIVQSQLAYNEIGQLRSKSLHSENGSANFLTTIDYTYNERGWVTKISSPQFTEQLKYTDGTVPQYNGNISQQLWGYAATTDDTFTYSYDKLNRLKSGTSAGTVVSEALTYDDMGNIRTLIRDGSTINYTYNNANKSNRLASLSGSLTGSYTYDANGNATKDRMGLTFTYNQLNLPKTASKTGTTVSYLYDAMGAKLRKTATLNGMTIVRDYLGGIEYNKTGAAASSIERIDTEEGYLQNNGGTYSYYYSLPDHLGNTRVAFYRNPSSGQLEVLQREDYYPFGKNKPVGMQSSNKTNYLYNGKELQEELEQYDYGARFYDPVIGRWNVVDPLAEDYYDASIYNYVLNNPINSIDPDGMDVESGPHYFSSTFVGPDGRIIKHDDDNDRNIYLVDNPLLWDGTNENLTIIGKEKKGIDYNNREGVKITQVGYEALSLKEVEIKGDASLEMVFALSRKFGPQGISQSFAFENLLIPGFRNISATLNIIEQMFQLMKGERNQAGSAGGTNNPFKKLKPDPNKPGNVLEKDSNGTTKSKIAPEGFKEWWNLKHPDKKI